MKKQDKTNQSEQRDFLDEEWNLPDEDAKEYINEVISELHLEVHDTLEDREAKDEEIIDAFIESDPYFCHKPKRPRYSEFGEWLRDKSPYPYVNHKILDDEDRVFDECEGEFIQDHGYREKISEGDVEERDLFERAENAIATGDVDDLLWILEKLANLRNTTIELGKLEHWAPLLSANATSPKKSEEESNLQLQYEITRITNAVCEELCRLIAENRRALQLIDWRRMEEIIATALEKIGFSAVITPPSKDGGKDVVATCQVNGEERNYFVEIKHWVSGKRVGSTLIFDFIEVNLEAKTDGGLFLSSSGFTGSTYSQLSEICRKNIRLGDEEKIVSLCQHFVRHERGLWTTGQSAPEILFEHTMS